MRNIDKWSETKFIKKGNDWIPSRDSRQVGFGSRFIAGIQIKLYKSLIEKYVQGDLLDLGCGSVPLYGIYKDIVKSVTCVDWKNTLHRNTHLDYTMDLTKKLTLKSNSYDSVILTDVLEHISEPVQLLEEVSRILRKKGKAIITVPFFSWLHEIPHDYHRYTEYSLRYMCEKVGLNVIELSPYGGSPEILFDFIAKHISFSRLLSTLHLWFSTALINLPTIQKLSLKSRKLFPLGYVLVVQK